uniref:Defensin n=1 Tax=Rhipicephalus zambeziensis TaxID=60191 RepID=A0A224Y385_9ACAR
MSALNCAFFMIFAITFSIINTSSSRYTWAGGHCFKCRSIGRPCHGRFSCKGICTCEYLGNWYGGYSYQCVEPPTAVPYWISQ